LPEPRRLPADLLIQEDCDATLVRVQGLLVNVRADRSELVLELQSAFRTFLARLRARDAGSRLPEKGSRLELTGVYAGQGGRREAGQDIRAFELLLNSPADIRVLARPPWWTLKRLLALVGVLLGVLALALVWINLLRRQVEKRSQQLKREIHEREQAEQRHAIEKERTRIAQDIHDELGCSLAQIRLLSEMALTPGQPPAEMQAGAARISGKAFEAARVMDEIVWAVDPQNDTLESLLSYLFSFASDYLSLAGIRFRIDAPTPTPQRALTTQARHHLFMAIKEALNNIVKHAGATEVRLQFELADGAACFILEDNGRGFDGTSGARPAPGASGLANMRRRLEEVGGEFLVEKAPDRGTRVKMTLPLHEATAA
jgi:signal transduction histidine kinase